MAICNIIIAIFKSFMELLASLNHTKQNKILEFYHIYHTREISENIKILFHDQNLSPQTPFLAYNLKYIELNYLSFLQVFFKAFFYTWWLNFSCHFQFCFYSSFFFFFLPSKQFFSLGWNLKSITWQISVRISVLNFSGLKFQPGMSGWNSCHIIAA